VTLRREASVAVAGAATEQEFFTRLQEAGVLVRLRHSTRNPGQVTGYAVGLAGHTARAGGVIWYGGGKLAADLSLPKLRTRWPGATRADPFGGAGLPAFAARALLRHKVTVAAAGARDEAGFFARLRDAGVQVRLRFSETDPGQVTGYAVTVPGHTGPGGAPAWYGGGRLAAGLTLPRLRARWQQPRSTRPAQPGTFRFTAPERNAIYTHAARQAAAATEHIRHCAYRDPAAASDAAWAAADTLHTAARTLRNRTLRQAADAYDRAARAPHGRIPRWSHAGERLRGTARLIVLASHAGEDTTIAVASLLTNLIALTTAVSELRQAQQHAAQAAAAHSAAVHLHAAMTNAPPGRSRTAQPRTARPGQTANAAHQARADFPAPLRPERAAPHDPRPAPRRRTGQAPRPSRRAGPAP
jgi:hypothetical protein